MTSVKVAVDRMHIGMVFADKSDEDFVATRGWVHSVKCQDFPKKGKVWTHSKGYSLTNASQPLSKGELFVRYGYHVKKFRAWYQFNPHKVDLIELGVHFNLMLGKGFNALYASGMTTYTEIAMDIDGVAFSDYFYIDKSLRSTCSSYQEIGTSYIGARQGNRSVTCYDKRKQLLKSTGEDIGHDRLRIEMQLRGANSFHLSDIATLENPFEQLMVIDRKVLAACTLPAAVSFNKRIAMSQDPQTAYATMTKQGRAETRLVLQQLQPSWWQHSQAWNSFPDSLNWVHTLRAQC